MHTRTLALFFAFLFLIPACGPIYDTQYTFSPPNSSHGRSCVNNCEMLRLQCRQIEDMRVSQCQQQSALESELCERELRLQENRSAKWYECGGTSCSTDYQLCEAQYRNCYQSCGGEVRAETRCVANCEQVQPTQPKR